MELPDISTSTDLTVFARYELNRGAQEDILLGQSLLTLATAEDT
jgi:hypothetical protein